MIDLRFFSAKMLAALVGLAVSCLGALAHPHVFVEARSKLVFDGQGQAVAIQHVFRFDDAYTAFAIQGFDRNQDGFYARDELQELADINIESMADFGFFTFGDDTKVELDFNTPTEYWLEVAQVPLEDYWVMKPEDFEAIREDVALNGGTMPTDVTLLELHFTLPLKTPVSADNTITLDVYDPTYYVDFRFAAGEAATGVINAPGSCSVTRKEPPPLDDAVAFALAQIGPEQRDLPPELQAAAATQVNQMIVTCGAISDLAPPGGIVAASNTAETPTADGTEMPSMEVPAVQSGLLDQWFGTIARLQSEFYQKLVGALRAFNSNPNAAWILVGLSFAYGVFHAAGPGHGKAVISSYVLANNETLKKGILLSFISAFAQAVTAIALVGGAAVVFKLTSVAIQDTARWFEVGSYVLVTGLGAWLLWQKAVHPLVQRFAGSRLVLAGAAPALVISGGHSHSHGDHHHHHHDHVHQPGADGVCSTCGHAHAPTPDMLAGRISFTRAWSIVLAVGLRPCTGALVVLVFALSQGMIMAGIGATLAMAVGTGITVSLLAAFAVGAREAAVRIFGAGSPAAGRVLNGIEIAAAAAVFLIGLTLLTAAVGWG